MKNFYSNCLKKMSATNIRLQVFTVLATFIPLLSFAQQWESVGPATGVSAGGSSFVNLAKDATGNLYISYYDVSVTKGSVQKYDGTSWSYLGGTPGITTGTATYNSLAVHDAQNIYYSNQDGYPNTGLNVRKFDGTSWAGYANPEGGSVTYQALITDGAGVVYAGYSTANGTVKRYVNGSWQQVGTTGFAAGGATYIDLQAGTNGKIYASFNNNGNVHVYQNDANAAATQGWTAVGVADIAPASASENYNSSLAIDANNNLYIAYVSNGAEGQKLNVKKFNGTAWVTLGAENFSTGRVQFVSLAVTPAGVPYVACSNWENDNFLKNYVYGFNNESWVQLGAGFVSQGEARYNSLIVDNNDDLVLAFTDSEVDKTVVKKFDIVTPIATYCEVNFSQGAEPVTNVTFAGINNTSADEINSTTLAYEDFTTVFGQVTAGSTYPVSVSGFNPANTIGNFSNHIVVYFDWNHNGSFLDANEVYYLGYIQGNAVVSTLTGNIAVPAGATLGNTRMRVIKKYYTTTNESVANPCNVTGYGQAEDYIVSVTAEDTVPVESVAIAVANNGTPAITTLAGTLQLTNTVLPANSNQNVVWSVTSGADFATVSQNGLVTATANGAVVIRAVSAEDTTIFGEITITVSNQVVSATCTFATLELTGFNADVVAEGTGGNADAKTSAVLDAANVFFAQDFVPSAPHSSAASAAAFGGGLPVNGTLTSVATQGLSYQFEEYTVNNALLLRNNLVNTGTLTLVTPKKANTIYVAAVSAEGNNDVTAVVNFDDATSQTFTLQATDWWQDGTLTNKVVSGLGRVSRGASWAPLNQFDGLTQTGIYQNELALDAANQNKLISSVTFTQTPPSGNATTTAILAVSICETPAAPATPAYGPVTVTSGFNYDIIANGVGNASQSTTVGFDEANTRALVSLDFEAAAGNAAPTYGLPVNGTINSAATTGVTFQLANYTGPNALFLTPAHVGNSAPNSGTLAFSAANVGKLYVLTAAAGGGSNSLTFNATVNFNDGTSQVINNVAVSDWYGGSNYAIQGTGRVNTANNNLEGNSTDPKLYEIALNIDAANQTKTVTGVNFSFAGDANAEYASQIRMSVLAISTAAPAQEQNNLTVVINNNAPAVITANQGTLELHANYNGDDIYSGLVWSLEPETFANIDMYGRVTAVANGTVTVRATLESDPTVWGEIEIVISGQAEGYCESYFVNGCAENASITSVATTGATIQLSNLNSGCSNDNSLTGYGDFTAQFVTAPRNGNVAFTVNFSSNSVYLSAWIDWNQDFIFAESERVYFSSDAEATSAVAFTVAVPADALLGATRIRLKGVNGWEGSGACGYNSYGEVEDYTFNVEESLGVDGVTINNYKIFPNPTSGFATIQTSEVVKEVAVYNMIGQQVSKGTNNEINLSTVEQGVYMVHILFENGTVATQKMIKK